MKRGILIIGHGSRYKYNEEVIRLQRDRMIAKGYKNVYIGFNQMSEPKIEDTLLQMVRDGIDDIIAFPFFIASGLHMTRDIPPKLMLKDGENDAYVTVDGKKVRIRFESPIGDDPNLARILHEKIDEVSTIGRNTGAMIVGHGSRLSFNKEVIAINAERLTDMGHKNVYYAFNELDEPTIEEVLDKMVGEGVDEAIVLPLFISPGDHLKNDIPPKIHLEDGQRSGTFIKDGKEIIVKYAEPIGRDPRLTDVIALRVDGVQ